MNLTLTEKKWILILNPAEWKFLESLPALAGGEGCNEASLRRLTPDPLDVPAGHRENYEEFLADWAELVQPDLNDSFQQARHQVRADLEAAVRIVVGDEANAAEENQFQIEIPIENVEPWYSTLNQARLLLNEEYDLAETAEQFRIAPGPGDGVHPEKWLERLMLLARYEFYTALQSVLVEHLMKP